MADEKELPTEEEEEESNILTLTDEDGKEEDFEVAASTVVDDVQYLALIPLGDGEETDEFSEYIILKVVTDESGEEMLETVDDDDEFDKMSEYFDNLFASEVDYDADEK